MADHTYAQQLARQRELDELRIQRPLTWFEQREADRLAYNAQMRAWRAVQRDREIALRRTAP